ncbi:MAG TPA: hypothetical protein VK835_11455 [Bacteroidia bacterium]|nr:hypothetical protein [Bacteroidia bacterium]
MNNKEPIEVVMEAKIISPQNGVIMDVVSAPFFLKKGMIVTSQLNMSVVSVNYASNDQGNFLKTSHTLPSGKYSYCAVIRATDVNDEYCTDLEADNSSFLFLVYPPDKDEIETKYPVLVWTHSDPFSINTQSEFYRMVVVDLKKDQSPEGAVNTNVPVYMKNYLTSHQVQYPIDAKELQAGNNYAWQVQKIYNGAISNKTEAWEFKLKAPEPIKENKYAVMKKTLDGAFYKAENNKIYFRFDEGYANNDVYYKILDDKQQVVSTQKSKEKGDRVKMEAVKTGYNQFMIDLSQYKMSPGIYVLEVNNEKKEVYKLKFEAE